MKEGKEEGEREEKGKGYIKLSRDNIIIILALN